MALPDEKKGGIHAMGSSSPAPSIEAGYMQDLKDNNDREVFKKTEDGVDFRTVSWIRASVIFLKVQFALGVLSIPTAMYALGAVPGSLSVIGWGALNTYGALLLGSFRNRHPGIHSVADMAEHVGGIWYREVCGALFIIGNVLCVGAGILAISTGINALSHHAACTVWWSLIGMLVVGAGASLRKFQSIGWVTWVGFVSIFVSVLIVVIAVTTRDRPAAAPQSGDFDLGYFVIAHPNFITGVSASATIFISSAGSSAFIPVMAEMKNPLDYNKAVYLCMSIVNGSYLAFSLVVYRWCGKWVASPSLGSAGQTIKMAAYGIAMAGLIASAIIYLHVAAKYLFVRFLRNSPHLQANTFVHWATWLSCTFGLCTLSFILAEAIPIFNYLLSLTSSICYAPLALMIPATFWLSDYRAWGPWYKGADAGGVDGGKRWVRLMAWWFHVAMFGLGVFMCVAGTYSTIKLIIEAYAAGQIGSAFSCADNSNSS